MGLILLIAVSLGLGLTGLAAFVWALRHDQFADPEGDARRILTPMPPAASDPGPKR